MSLISIEPMNARVIVSIVLFAHFLPQVYSQIDKFQDIARANMMNMTFTEGQFSGEGWEFLRGQAKNSFNVLVGEDHFTKEIPQFVTALGLDSQFDNFYIEVDPYTTEQIATSFDWPDNDRLAFNQTYGHSFSFYSLKEEYLLLEKMVDAGVNLLGSDQIVMYDDRMLCDFMSATTSSLEAKDIYRHISEQSEINLEAFLENPQNPMYMMTPDFMTRINRLSKLKLSPLEAEIVNKLRLSHNIYSKQSHELRVKLLKHHLMKDYAAWSGKRNLFKFGANHMARGESFLTVMDIGNLVANITAADFKESLHVMILGESGMQASPFEVFPPTPIDPQGFYLKHLEPLFELTQGDNWFVFNLVPIRKELEAGRLELGDKNLERTVKGFDLLVLIPVVTPATFHKF